jgi:hypothetical protein
MKLKLLIALPVFLVSACSNPVTNSAGSDQASASSFDSAISWTKKLARGWTAKASLQVPAQGIIADALLDPNFSGVKLDGAILRIAVANDAHSNDFQKYMKTTGPGASGKMAESLSYLMPVNAVTSAYRGWQISMIDMSAFGQPEASNNEKYFYVGFQEASVEYTNALFTQIATKLNDDVGVLEDPDTAKTEIQRIYKTIPKDSLKKLWNDAVDRAAVRSGRTIDEAGSKGVDWSADGMSYSGNADGLTWTKSGVTWFGKGALSGKQWTIGLESSISKSTDKSSSGSEGVGGNTGEKSSAGAQPK